MLWTDRVFLTAAELSRLDSEISSVATAEEISFTGANSLLRGAMEEASNELMKMVVSFGGYIGTGGVSPNHLAAVMNIGMGTAVRRKCSLSQIVVSGEVSGSWNVISQWAAFYTLMVFYRDAFNRTVKDRYEGKMRYYKSELSRRITPGLYGLGIPLVTQPLACPGAFFEKDSGTWDSSNVSLTPGSGNITADYDVAITYVDMSQADRYVSASNRGNAESHPSETLPISLTTGNVIEVDISTLNPPDGTQSSSQQILCVVSPQRATHWNVYAGVRSGTLYLQNPSPIAIGTTSYTLTGNPTLSGPTPGIGQYPTRYLSLTPTRQRA